MNRTIVLRHLANSSLAGQTREFRQPRVRIGRKPDNYVVFDPTLDRVVSGHHCEVVCDDGTLYVDDPGSTNGTFVNGRRVQGRMPVSERDQVTLGDQGPAFAVAFAPASATAGDGASPPTIMGSLADLVPSGQRAAAAAGANANVSPNENGGRWATGLLDLPAEAPADDLPPTLAPPPQPAPAKPSASGPAGWPTTGRNGNGVGGNRGNGGAPAPQPASAPLASGSTRALVTPPPPVAAVPAAPPPPPAFAPPMQVAPPTSSRPGGQKTSIGMNTLMVELHKATRRERRRMLALIAPAAAALAVAGGLVWYKMQGSPLPEVKVQTVVVPVPGVPAPGASPSTTGGTQVTLPAAPPIAVPSDPSPNASATPKPSSTGGAPSPGFAPAPGAIAPGAPAPLAVAPASPAPSAPSVAIAPPPPVPPASSGPREWAQVLGERKNAVYLVLIQRPGKEDSPQGTAWSAGPGLLATNAHVADLFNELGPSDILVCRSNTNPPVDLRVTGVKVHPGFTEFGRLQAAYYPVDPDTGRPLSFPATYDAALMTVRDADRPNQAKPLDLADAADLAKLRETAELAYIGYPQEGSIEGGVNARMPEPHQLLGNLSRKTDVFLSAANEARSNFLQYTLVVQGGASGSPVFNRDGKVVGLVAGNDVIGRGSQGARIMVSGKSFGPRVDIVRELLDGSADAKLAPVAAEWRAAFRERYDRADKAKQYAKLPAIRAELAFDITAKAKTGRGEKWKLTGLEKVKTWTVSSADLSDGDAAAGGGSGSGGGTGGVSVVRDFSAGPLPEAGYYCVVLSSDNPDVTPKLSLPEVDEVLTNTKSAADLKQTRGTLGEGTPQVSSFPIRRDAGTTLRFTVGVAGKAPPGAQATLTATLYRAVAGE